ncbi:CaiB/BaiF CoA transferase family protein [Sphingomonas montanisoli]|uniref:CoA transferase n=1 Tax=Sphingomonas montanisoli TaxID=2606412 RepID=A0A5D9C0Z6_9SPHN|nr:CoA transferase [Sphingomonas montanisoli]TZG24710.1 CoA transferase [Sphingomonas montanisoli]
MAGVLDGIRVLDFGRYVAGPYGATVLADFGADVIRVERRQGGEDRLVAPITDDGEGSIFLQMSRNKRSVAIDTRTPESKEVLRRLIESADVVMANVPDSALAGMGIDYETLKSIKPDIILSNVSSFGPIGPWKDKGGFDSVGQAMSGGVHLTGTADQPYRTPISWVDHATGLYAAIGVMMALWERNKSGRGQQIDGSLLGSAVSFSTTYLVEQAALGIDRTAIGNRSFINGPTDIYKTTDGWIVTQVVSNPLFKRWTKLMGEPEWLDDPRFASDGTRGDNGDVLSERMGRWCAERTSDQAIGELGAAGIPAAPVLSPREVLDHPQVEAMGMKQHVPYPGLADGATLFRMPVNLSETPADIRTPPPTLGQHTSDVLTELGFSADEVAALKASETI